MIMDAKKLLNSKGQAMVEFVLFLPFMIMMYMSVLSIGNSINASINQQKITRGYFYYRSANNSTLPKPSRSGEEASDSWGTFGMSIIGWAKEFESDKPVAACFKFQLPTDGGEEDVCEEPYSQPRTQFVRVRTVYGLCGATYRKNRFRLNTRYPAPENPTLVIDQSACLIGN